MQLSKKIILISLALLIFTRPLICGVTFKWSNTLFQLLVLIMAMAWLLEMCLKGEFTFKKTAINLPLGIFFLFFIVSIFRSVHLHESIVLTFQFLSYALLYFVVANNVEWTSKKDINLLLFTMAAAYVLVVGYGYYQYFWGFEATREYVRTHPSAVTSTPQFQIRLKDNAVFSFFVFAPALAGYLVVIFPVLLSLIILSSKIWQRVSYLVILFAGIIILFLTYSKGGWLAFGLTLVLYLFIFQPEVLKRNKWDIRPPKADVRLGGRLGGKMILSGILVAAIVISALYSINPARVPRLKNLLGSFNTRLQYWEAAVDMIKDRPLLGFGPGTFGSIYPRYKLPDAEETQLAHNNYIQVWVESGVFAFLAYMWIILNILWLVFRNQKKMESASGGPWRKDENQVLKMGLSLGIIAFLIHSIVDFNLYIPGISAFFWIFMGLVSSSYSDSDYKLTQAKACDYRVAATFRLREKGNYIKISISKKWVGIFASIIILVSCLSTYLVLMPMRAQIYANAASRYMDGVGKTPESLSAAIPLLQNAIKYDHTFGEYHFDLARTYETILDAKANRGEGIQDDEVMKVVHSYENAIRYNYYMPFYHYRLGLIYWKWAGGKDREKIDLAIKEFKTASWLYPTKAFYKQELEAIYKAIGGNE